jgi:hypothetical protein
MRLPEGASTDYRTPLGVVHPPDSEAKSLTRSGRPASGDANYWILNTGYPLGSKRVEQRASITSNAVVVRFP